MLSLSHLLLLPPDPLFLLLRLRPPHIHQGQLPREILFRARTRSPFRTADIAELRLAPTSHVSTAFIMLDKTPAAVTPFPALYLCEVDRRDHQGVFGTFGGIGVAEAAAYGACFLGAHGAGQSVGGR